MGLFDSKQKETADVAAQAQAAAEAGQSRFVLRLSDVGAKTGEVADWGETIGRVEQHGWVVDQFSTHMRPETNTAFGYVLFRREGREGR